MSSEAGGPEGGRWLSTGQRNAPQKSRLKTRPPTGDCPFLYTSRPPQREEVSSHLDTNRGKQKPSHLLPPCPPCLAAAPCPQPTVGSLFWSPEPRRPCSLGAQTQAGKGGDRVPRPPCSVSHPGQDQPPRTSPRPLGEHHTSAAGSTSRVGLPRLVSCTTPCHGQGHAPAQIGP